MPVEGEEARYVTLTIKYLSAKCTFQSEDVACEFCRTRNISTPCIKKWGTKRQEQLARSISTTIDEAIPSEYVSFLQYTYKFEQVAEAPAGRLVKKLAFIFHFSINQVPPCEAILKFARTFLHTPHSSKSSDNDYWQSYRELMSKTHTAFVDADLFATGLLPALYGFTADQGSYIPFFNTIIEILLSKAASHETMVAFPLLPILRETMMEDSQHVQLSDLLLQFCQKSRKAMEQSGFDQRADFLNEFIGCESREAALSECLWQCCRLLRKCFRFVLTNESEGRLERSVPVRSAITHMKTYLESDEVRYVLDRIAARKITERIEQKIEADYGSPTHTLLIYRFCRLLAVLLHKPTILEATTSSEAIAVAISVLEFIRAEFTPSNRHLYYRRSAYGILPRVLSMAGLQFSRSAFPERNVILSVFSNVVSF